MILEDQLILAIVITVAALWLWDRAARAFWRWWRSACPSTEAEQFAADMAAHMADRTAELERHFQRAEQTTTASMDRRRNALNSKHKG